MNVACQDPLSMGFSRQEYWSGLPCPPPGDLPDPGVKPTYYVSCIGIDATWEALIIPSVLDFRFQSNVTCPRSHRKWQNWDSQLAAFSLPVLAPHKQPVLWMGFRGTMAALKSKAKFGVICVCIRNYPQIRSDYTP